MEPRHKDDPPGFRRAQNDVDRIFLELLRGERTCRYGGTYLRPNADVYFDRRQRILVIKLELAGIDPATIDLEVDDGVLRVGGNRVDSKHPDAVYQQMEISYGRFERRVPLPPEVDTANASADYTNGFLEILLPLKQRSGRRRISIDATEERPSAGEAGQSADKGDK
ncbi:MAG: Hsp20/alpha crystallin family protein [Thermoleophilia bacterium]